MRLQLFHAFGQRGFAEIEAKVNSWLDTEIGSSRDCGLKLKLLNTNVQVSTVGDAPGELYQCIVCSIWYDWEDDGTIPEYQPEPKPCA